jgi:hypothetical protein
MLRVYLCKGLIPGKTQGADPKQNSKKLKKVFVGETNCSMCTSEEEKS